MTNLPRLYAPLTAAGVRGGTPLTLDRAIDVLGAYVEEQDRLTRQAEHAVQRFMAVKTKTAKARWRATLDALRPRTVAVDRAVERLENQIDEYTNALAEREKVREKEREGGESPPPPSADEWQFGLTYEASRGRSHDVDLNIDIRRVDGALITEREAREALAVRIDTGSFPDIYEVALVEYRSPNGSGRGRMFRSGGLTAEKLDEVFDAVIINTNLYDWRAGGIAE